MSKQKWEPTVPLSVAELLYVVLATAEQSGQLDARTKENVSLILATYRIRRDAYVKSKGFDDVDIEHYSAAAAEALASWLEDRAKKAEAEEDSHDFAEFEKEFGERQEEDPNQDPNSGWQRAGEDYDGAGGAVTPTTSSDEWGPGGPEADPGFPPFKGPSII